MVCRKVLGGKTRYHNSSHVDRVARRPVTCYIDYSDLLMVYSLEGAGGCKKTFSGYGAEGGGWWLEQEWSKKGYREMRRFRVIWLASDKTVNRQLCVVIIQRAVS